MAAAEPGAPTPSGLLDRHVAFLDALRAAGMPVSLSEGLDAIDAVSALSWDDRETVRTAYAATLVKRQLQRPTFDATFDLFFPRLLGEGVATEELADEHGIRDSATALEDLRERLAEALLPPSEQPEERPGKPGEPGEPGQQDGQAESLQQLATEAVGRFGQMPGRAPGRSGWSAYNTLRRVAPGELAEQLAAALRARGRTDEEARAGAARRIAEFSALVEADARRRIAVDRPPGEIARITLRPTIDRLDFTSARKADLEEMRRQLYPLSRRLASRLTKEQHARRRGPLDFRRTVRASISTGGVPLTTHHRPKRPHRTELVVLCDVSGSVASFAQFTLMLVFALREQFSKVRAFTFVDEVHEVTDVFNPGADPGEVMAQVAARAQHAARFGRTNYGQAFSLFAQRHADALGPKASLLVLGDARSNYSDLGEGHLRELVAACRNAWWLNPEHPRQWGAGDSAAPVYGSIVPMVECRNLVQLEQFVHDLV
ncbi:vWA domain-containing protein [Nocardioides campestrisoli]|uniref:vWA domain-containing protein n=1 Tax=Nocardioides campestrisoli TaxID=2736757 RepID=UPI002811C590|nr:VWA domain-containing protein [Nocardioides campestrisoli]